MIRARILTHAIATALVLPLISVCLSSVQERWRENALFQALSPPKAYGAIDIDSVSTRTTTFSTLTISHTTSGTNRLMLVGVSLATDGFMRTVSSVTYNGVSLSPVGTRQYFSAARIEIWKLVDPDTGTSNVVVTFSGSPWDGATAGVMTFTGVDQTTPLGSFSSSAGNSNWASVTVSSAVDELVFDVLAVESPWDYFLSPGGGQTKQWDLNRGRTNGGGSTEPGASSVTMSWSFSSNPWALGAVPIKPAAPLPVQLSSFTGRPTSASAVVLEWSTISEVNNYGFFVQRHLKEELEFNDLPKSFIPGSGTTLEPQHYSFTDKTASPGTWFYRLKQVDLDGSLHYSEPIEITVDAATSVSDQRIPVTFALEQNYPNPFNPATLIEYSLPMSAQVSFRVYNLLGQEVITLVEELQETGVHSVRFDASVLPSGIYLYKLTAGDFSETKRMTLLR